jgi:cell division protein FtsN
MATMSRRRAGSGPGPGQWLALSGAVLVILCLTFALGLLVGRQWARPSLPPPPPSVSEAARKAPTPARRSGIAAETMADRAPESTEKLTFYQTLTEPLSGPGAPPKPETKPVAIKAPAAAPSPAPSPVPAAAPTSVSLPPAQGRAATPAATAAGPPWTIQVGAFKNRKQADDMRQHLASAGVEAYVAELVHHGGATQDGQARFRVRVGSYRTREEAAATAERLRAQRSLSAFVTLK